MGGVPSKTMEEYATETPVTPTAPTEPVAVTTEGEVTEASEKGKGEI